MKLKQIWVRECLSMGKGFNMEKSKTYPLSSATSWRQYQGPPFMGTTQVERSSWQYCHHSFGSLVQSHILPNYFSVQDILTLEYSGPWNKAKLWWEMWPVPEVVVEVTAPEGLPVLVTAADTPGCVYLTARLCSAPRKCSFQVCTALQCCSGTAVRGSALPHPKPQQPARCGTGLLWDRSMSKVLGVLGTLPTTWACASQGHCDLDMGT